MKKSQLDFSNKTNFILNGLNYKKIWKNGTVNVYR